MKHLSASMAARLAPLVLNTRGKQRLSILIYHRVVHKRDFMRPDVPTVEEFEWQMRLLFENFTPLSLSDGLERMRLGSLPERAVCVTFDDGYADNELCALPVLQKYRIPATVFVSTGFINGGRMWNDSVIESVRNFEAGLLDLRELELGLYTLETIPQRQATAENIIQSIKHLDPVTRGMLVNEIEKRVTGLPSDLMLTDAQIVSMAGCGVDIGAHTVNHPIMASISGDLARKEVSESKSYLENLLQEQVKFFAYPNGKPGIDYGRKDRDMVEQLGFLGAVSTQWGVCTDNSDSFQLPRFTPWDKSQLKFALRLLINYRRVEPLIVS